MAGLILAAAGGTVLGAGTGMFVLAACVSVLAPAMIQELTASAPENYGSVTALYTFTLFLGASLAPLPVPALAGAVAPAALVKGTALIAVLCFLLALVLTALATRGHHPSHPERTDMHSIHHALTVPEHFTETTVRQEKQADRPVTVVRHHPHRDPGYGGEHVTFVHGADGTVHGYTCQTDGFPPADLPTSREAERVAFAFLRDLDPDFAHGLTVKWIDRHDETITTATGESRTVSGMKVKTRHSSGLYTWVIVGAGDRIITYERDIRWSSGRSRRSTAMWLHDAWITARDTGGPELGGFHAPLNA